MDIFTTSDNRNVTCDIAPINSRIPVHPVNSDPVSIAYNSAIYASNDGSTLHIFLIFNQNPTNLKYEGSSISSYVEYDSEAELYYINYGISSGSGYVGTIETCMVELFRGSSAEDIQEYHNYISTLQIVTITSNGGGATHIAKVTGQLKDLSSNLSDILIVSGGGGGGMLIGDTAYPGADAGGIAGNSDNSADQTTGYAFGQGENG